MQRTPMVPLVSLDMDLRGHPSDSKSANWYGSADPLGLPIMLRNVPRATSLDNTFGSSDSVTLPHACSMTVPNSLLS
jgi:hypothetical protein